MRLPSSRRRSRALVVALGVAGLGAVTAGQAFAATGDIDLVSRSNAGAPATKTSTGASISADGNRVAFISQDQSLGPVIDALPVTHAWVRDIANAATIPVGEARGATISAGGRFVAAIGFDDGRGYYRRDLLSGTSDPGDDWNKEARGGRPAISADGSRMTAAKPADSPLGAPGLYIRDFVVPFFTRVQPEPASPAVAGAVMSISADGRFFAFESDQTLAGDAGGVTDVFVRDIATGRTSLVSTGPAGPGNGDSFDAAISADGRYVAFSSDATNLSAEDDDTARNVYVRDLQAGTTALVSRSTGAAGAPVDIDAEFPAISGDGRFVSFATRSLVVSPTPTTGTVHLYVRDIRAGTTTAVDRVPGSGALGNGDAGFSSLSGDGRFIAFESTSTNLVVGAFGGSVFRADLGAPAALPAAGGPAPGTTGTGGTTSFRCAGVLATRVGTPGRDVIRGTARRDVIVALGGNDRVSGLGGDDLICLGAGNDVADGGAGRDRVLGGAGTDVLRGGAGRDLLDGGAGADRLAGGAGRDVLRGGPGRDAVAQ